MVVRSRSRLLTGRWGAGPVTLSLLAAACGGGAGTGSSVSSATGAGSARAYTATPLVADTEIQGATIDPNLVNPWGIAYGPDTFFWIANNGTGTSTVYDGDGRPQPNASPLVVNLPLPEGASDDTAKPTGLVYQGEDGYAAGTGGQNASARFIFATEEGTLLWTPALGSDQAFIAVDASGDGAIFKGLTLVQRDDRSWLLAADFRNGVVRAYDSQFQPIDLGPGAFVDPDLPSGYAPFGIQRLGDFVYVTYALQDEDKEDDVAGEGNGYVSQFDPEGGFVARVASEGLLNAPWAVTRAPDDFGAFGGALLIGNFGDGTIHAFDRESFEPLGVLQDENGEALVFDGLWGLTFGNGRQAGDTNTLYYTAGPNDESRGVFGKIEAQ